jgi:uncharacterized membrane protein (DUF441 family)
MSAIRTFARFWWDFVVGDDWRVAAGLAVGLTVTWILARSGVPAWWLLPVWVAALLVATVRREAAAHRPGPGGH